MTEETIQRAYGLVEELRAEVDFEIDDVISNIIRNLPEEYFESLSNEDQITHLKALLAISICNLKTELTLRSEDGRHIAVVARKDYPGLLAKIISRLPENQMLVGAKIFTSKTHDFIIDLFEFKTSSPIDSIVKATELEIRELVETVSRDTARPLEQVSQFVSFYHPSSHVLKSSHQVREHFLAFEEACTANKIAVRWSEEIGGGLRKLTVATGRLKPRTLFLKIAEFLGTQNIGVEQAYLDDFNRDVREHIAISSFVIGGDLEQSEESIAERLAEFLNDAN